MAYRLSVVSLVQALPRQQKLRMREAPAQLQRARTQEGLPEAHGAVLDRGDGPKHMGSMGKSGDFTRKNRDFHG